MVGICKSGSLLMCLAGLILSSNLTLAAEGLMLPLGSSCLESNNFVTVSLFTGSDEAPLPESMDIYKPLSEFVAIGDKRSARVNVHCKLCIENHSPWLYVFDSLYSLSGWYSLEVDLKLDSGEIAVMKRRRPSYLSDNGSHITLKPGFRWARLVSFDSRLWTVCPQGITNGVVGIRPRFAYGSYMVNGKYFRTPEEIRNRKAKHRTFNRNDPSGDDREGELVGEWIDYKGDIPASPL